MSQLNLQCFQERQALLEQDLARARTDAEVARRNYEAEKRQLQSDADDARKELNMKAAALQSLMLAKQDNTKLEMLTEENKRMQASVEELQTNLRDAQVLMAQQLTNKLDQYHTNRYFRSCFDKHMLFSSNAAQEELQRRLEDMESRLKHAQERSDNIEAEKVINSFVLMYIAYFRNICKNLLMLRTGRSPTSLNNFVMPNKKTSSLPLSITLPSYNCNQS